MNSTTRRYQKGGDIYAKLAAQYGETGAQRVAAAAIKAEEQNDPSLIGDALGLLKFGENPETSTFKIFAGQIYNEPLTAPLEQLSSVTENTVSTVFSFKNWGLWVLLAALVGYLVISRKL